MQYLVWSARLDVAPPHFATARARASYGLYAGLQRKFNPTPGRHTTHLSMP
jgi:hypothetical protein